MRNYLKYSSILLIGIFLGRITKRNEENITSLDKINGWFNTDYTFEYVKKNYEKFRNEIIKLCKNVEPDEYEEIYETMTELGGKGMPFYRSVINFNNQLFI